MEHNFEAWYPELPTLLFGKIDDVTVFNATYFMENSKCAEKSIDGFKDRHQEVIKYLMEKLGMKADRVFIIDDESNVFIHESLALPFVSYINPFYTLYFCDKLHELFTEGIIISDNHLAMEAKRRLPKKLIAELAS